MNKDFPRHSTPDTRHSFVSPIPVIHLVDDDPSFRKALTRLLRAANYDVRSYASAAEFVASRMPGEAGCIILDLQMPGVSGLELQQSIAGTDEPLPIIFLTGNGNIPASVRAMKAGAIDFLTKPVERETLLRAVGNALERDAAERISRANLRDLRGRYQTLTAREREVLAHVVGGKLNKQIAFDLGTTERTIKAHRAKIMEKLSVQSVAELTRLAQSLGIDPIS